MEKAQPQLAQKQTTTQTEHSVLDSDAAAGDDKGTEDKAGIESVLEVEDEDEEREALRQSWGV